MAALTAEHQVANLALGMVGQRQLLNSLAENSTEAELARTYFASTRDEVLSAWEWRFARQTAVLALTTETKPGWEYAYAMPANCLLPRRIWNGQRETLNGRGDPIPFTWELSAAGNGHLVLTDQPQAQLIYTVSLAAVALWPAHFVKAMAAQLAVYLAASLPIKPQVALALEQRAIQALRTAAAIDANAAQADEEADAEAVRVR
jgi:hypothetical protein